jgi:hypothetical protein
MLAHSPYPQFLKIHRYTKRKHVKKKLEGLKISGLVDDKQNNFASHGEYAQVATI